MRIGHWLMDTLGTSYITPAVGPEALLSLGFWPGAAQKDFGTFWSERFQVDVSMCANELIHYLLPQVLLGCESIYVSLNLWCTLSEFGVHIA